MAYHSKFPSYQKKGKPNTFYVPFAWFKGQRCVGSTFVTDGEQIHSNNHIIGFTDQCDNKVLFSCKRNLLTLKHVKGMKDFAEGNTTQNMDVYPLVYGYKVPYRILPYCPSCGENPPESYLKKLRGE